MTDEVMMLLYLNTIEDTHEQAHQSKQGNNEIIKDTPGKYIIKRYKIT